MSLLCASLQQQRCVYVFASQRCVYAPRCDGSAASTSLLRASVALCLCFRFATLRLHATLRRQRCIYVTPSRYAATAALRDVSRFATLQRSSARKHPYIRDRMNTHERIRRTRNNREER